MACIQNGWVSRWAHLLLYGALFATKDMFFFGKMIKFTEDVGIMYSVHCALIQTSA